MSQVNVAAERPHQVNVMLRRDWPSQFGRTVEKAVKDKPGRRLTFEPGIPVAVDVADLPALQDDIDNKVLVLQPHVVVAVSSPDDRFESAAGGTPDVAAREVLPVAVEVEAVEAAHAALAHEADNVPADRPDQEHVPATALVHPAEAAAIADAEAPADPRSEPGKEEAPSAPPPRRRHR